MKKENFLEILKLNNPEEINRMIEEKGKKQNLLDPFDYLTEEEINDIKKEEY